MVHQPQLVRLVLVIDTLKKLHNIPCIKIVVSELVMLVLSYDIVTDGIELLRSGGSFGIKKELVKVMTQPMEVKK